MSLSPMALVREDLQGFAGYRSARSSPVDGEVWLNANEAPWPNPATGTDRLRRYPDPQPDQLRAALASHYGCSVDNVLVGRGSDEGIDLLVRALCRPGGDAVVVTPPTFGMYEVCARLHGADVLSLALLDTDRGFECDFRAVVDAAIGSGAKLVFLCSPGNPAGNRLPLDAIQALARELQGRALVVVDEAYVEFAQAPSAVTLISRHRNVAVLRTLSKAFALAGARLGCVVADPELIALLRRCQAPYPLPAPCVELACRALDEPLREALQAQIDTVIAERAWMASALRESTQVRRVYPSSANFLLVRFVDPQAAQEALLRAGIVVRDMRGYAGLEDALRITIGTSPQNDRVVEAIATMERAE
jgi:histidinol-phosphate aminotransferase